MRLHYCQHCLLRRLRLGVKSVYIEDNKCSFGNDFSCEHFVSGNLCSACRDFHGGEDQPTFTNYNIRSTSYVPIYLAMVNVASELENNVIKSIDFPSLSFLLYYPEVANSKANIYFHDNAIQTRNFSHKNPNKKWSVAIVGID